MFIAHKSCLLVNYLEKNERLFPIHELLGGSPEGYREAIVQMEKTFGGSVAERRQELPNLVKLPVLKDTSNHKSSFLNMERFHNGLCHFHQVSHAIGWYSAVSEEGNFHVAFACLDAKVQQHYVDWLLEHGRPESLETLCEWETHKLEGICCTNHLRIGLDDRKKITDNKKTNASQSSCDSSHWACCHKQLS